MRIGAQLGLLVLLATLAPTRAPAQSADEPAAPEAREVLRTCRDPLFINCFKNWRPGMEDDHPQRPPPPNAAPNTRPSPSAPSPFGKADPQRPDATPPAEPEAAPSAPTKPAPTKPEDKKLEDKGPEDKGKDGDAAATAPQPPKTKETNDAKPKDQAKPPAPPKEPEKPAAPPPEETSREDMQTYEALVRAIHTLGLQDRLRIDTPPKAGSVTLEVAPPKGGLHPTTVPPPSRPFAPMSPDER